MRQGKPVNRIPSLLLIIIIGLSTGYTNAKNTPHICFHSKRSHTITTMNDNINMDSTIAGSMNDNINMDSTIAGSMNDNINMDSTIVRSMNDNIKHRQYNSWVNE